MKNRKELGQHWLKEREILERIGELAAEADFGEVLGSGCARAGEDAVDEEGVTCLEVGPGLGTLTSVLLRRFERVVAVELDERLAENLPKSFPGKEGKLEVVRGNFLDFDLGQIEGRYVVCANIPYYITSPIMRKLLAAERRPERIVLLVQKEVAERIVQGVGRQTLLSMMIQNLAEVNLEFVVPAEKFVPPPKVDSAVIVLVPRARPLMSEEAMEVAKVGFANPRKKLVNNLAGRYGVQRVLTGILEAGLAEGCRAADLGHEDWERLAGILGKNVE